MIASTRRWFRRNATNLAIGAGVVGVGYLAGQYVLGKINEARQRMREEGVAKENLRRRFEQNQEDCTYTVLALLPTVRDEIIGALPVEQLTEQLQRERQERLQRMGASEASNSEFPSVPPSVTDEDGKSLSSSSYVHTSQMAGSTTDGGASSLRPKRSKAQLWQDMKIQSITRALTLIYTLSLLTLLTRVQLNLLGRRTYLSSVVALASPPEAQQSSTISLENRDDDNYDNVYGNDFETNRKYLTFSWWLLHRGSKQIMERVTAAVKDVFGQVNIREDMTLARIADLIMQVRMKIEGATQEERQQMRWLSYLLPPREEEVFVVRQAAMSSDSDNSPSPEIRPNPITSETTGTAAEDTINGSLRRLLDETSDLIDSPTFCHVLTRLLDQAYSHLVDYRLATEAFRSTGPIAPGVDVQGMSAYAESRITDVTEERATCKLAHVLPVFCKQAHAIAVGSGDLDAMAAVTGQETSGNEYLNAIDQVPELEAFAAVIYSSNFEQEVAEDVTEKETQVQTSRPTFPDISQQVAQVPETEPTIVVDSMLGESALGLPSGGALDDAPTAVDSTVGGEFEAAWKKAVLVEDAPESRES